MNFQCLVKKRTFRKHDFINGDEVFLFLFLLRVLGKVKFDKYFGKSENQVFYSSIYIIALQ